jgi:hypothetical protein
MATDAGELVVTLRADIANLKSGISQVNQSIQGFSDGFKGSATSSVVFGNLITQAFQKLFEVAKQGFTDYMDYETQVNRLNIALKNQGLATDAMRSYLLNYAEQLQTTTSFSNEQILSTEALFTTYGLAGKQLKDSVVAAMDLAIARNIDLETATNLLGRAFQGNTAMLGRYGLKLNESTPNAEKFGEVLKMINDRMGGAAQNELNTTAGLLTNLKNNFEDVAKSIMGKAAPAVNTFIDGLNTFFEDVKAALDRNDTSNKTYTQNRIAEMEKQIIGWNNLKEISGGVLSEESQMQLDATQKALKYLKMKDDAEQASVQKSLNNAKANNKINTDETQQKIDNLNKQIVVENEELARSTEISGLEAQKKILDSKLALASMQADEATMSTTVQLETQKRLETSALAYETNASFSDQLKIKMVQDLNGSTAAFVNMGMQMIDSFANSTAKMIVEGGKFSDIMKNLWQQMAEAFIAQVIRMIAEWLILQAMTGGMGGFGGVLGGFATGGMVNEPSVITGMRSGRKHFVAENGPEMIVPTTGGGGGSDVNQPFDQAPQMGGNSVSININGNFLEGSAAKWQRLVRETILPEIRRSTMVMSTGPFNRVRGAA